MHYWKYNHPGKNVFTWLVILFFLSGLFLLSSYSKDSLFWMLNQQHTYPGDLFLSYFTHAGDGLVMLALGVLLLGFGKRKLGIMMLVAFVISGLIAQGVKKLKPEPRPGRYFSHIEQIHKVNEMPLKGNNSFPSGHTTTAFAMFALLAFNSRNYFVQGVYFLLAFLVGYSRIYLGHHFFKDVFVGLTIGYLTSLFTFWLFRNKEFNS